MVSPSLDSKPLLVEEPIMRRVCLALLCYFVVPSLASAEVTSLTILQRQPFAAGKPFGDAGPYEKFVGIAKFAVDPKDKHNSPIVDLENAPTNAKGKVEFEADVVILAPKNLGKGRTLFYDVNNRGNKLALRMFNYAPGGNDLDKLGSQGDGFLMKNGVVVVWSGWIGELLPGDGRLLLKAPVATDQGKPIRGLVRFEMSTDASVPSLPLSRREGHGSYTPTPEGLVKAVLTKRLTEGGARQDIPRDKWKLERLPVPAVKQGVAGTLGQVRLHLQGGFEPGVLYELICECEGPIVQGVSLASVRDLISFLRYDSTDKNPLRDSIQTTLGFGVSQSGRFLRHFLWQGFNEDEQGRIVFDGLMPHVAGGGLGFFNQRFAQPTRHNGQHEDHLYPADMFPFAYGTMTDPLSKRTDGILRVYEKSKCMPKVLHTQSAAEYWHRSGSLVHTDPLGKEDAVIPSNVRIYAFGGTQHGPAADPPPRGFGDNLTNPGDYRIFLRALVLQLRDWCQSKEPAAPSVYPKIADKTLVDWQQQSTGFPKLPGVRYPQVIQQPVFADYGPKFFSHGLVEQEPPKVMGHYVVLVPKCDQDGNDLGALLAPEVKVPLATYTGWNLRRKDGGADGMLLNLMGSYLPFAKTKADRLKSGDPRLSLEERYASFDGYVQQFEKGAGQLSAWALADDLRAKIDDRKKVRALFAK
jgi:hypothetical protein